MINWLRNNWRSLRFQLIGWYVLLLILTLTIFSIYIFFQFRSIEQSQQDNSLQAAAASVNGLIDPGGPPGSSSTNLHFRVGPGFGSVQDLTRQNIQLRLLNPDGKVIDSLGALVGEMPQSLPTAGGFVTLSASDSGQWRVLNSPITFRDNRDTVIGWLQVGQPLLVVNTQLSNLFTPILLGTLIALLLAVLGGLFLANRALSPIDRVTRTAQSISAQELSKRINYHGPNDEIGRLAKTLDQMLERLERGFEQERRFTSDASHELRTPLTALKGRIEVTLSRARNKDEYQQTLEDLHQEVDRLITLSSSLLYLARLDQSGHQWQSEMLDLSDLLDSILETMQPVAELKDIELKGNITPRLEVPGNLDQLTRLFLNLLDNALKYTPAGGKVTLRLEKADKRAFVAISDTGPGIAPEHLPHLFKRFYRAQSDRASSTGGAGLGLAIAYEIGRQHGGTIEVESKVGQGTTMKVQLPLSQPQK